MIKQIHRAGAALLGLFIISHLAVHAAALWGPEAHITALKTVQWTYRNPIGETVLFLAIMSQVITGARRMRFSSTSLIAWAQAASGAYLIFFLIIHASAAFLTRHMFGLETNFYWVAASLHYDPIRWGFALYYAAAIIAVFVHLSAAASLAWPGAAKLLIGVIPSASVVLAALILASFWGLMYPIEITPAAITYVRQVFGFLGVTP
jgi:hypothetical protein